MNFEKRNGVEFKPNKKVSLCFQNKFVVFSKKWTVITVGKCAIKLNIFLKTLKNSGIFILVDLLILLEFEEIFIEKLSIFHNTRIYKALHETNIEESYELYIIYICTFIQKLITDNRKYFSSYHFSDSAWTVKWSRFVFSKVQCRHSYFDH